MTPAWEADELQHLTFLAIADPSLNLLEANELELFFMWSEYAYPAFEGLANLWQVMKIKFN